MGFEGSLRSEAEVGERDIHQVVSRVAVVTGATRNLGLALVEGLARQLGEDDVVYLTSRDPERVAQALATIEAPRAQLRGEALDVADADAVAGLAATLAERHGRVDVVFSNAYHRVEPEDDPAAVIERYAAVNNLGTTSMLRAFAPLLPASTDDCSWWRANREDCTSSRRSYTAVSRRPIAGRHRPGRVRLARSGPQPSP